MNEEDLDYICDLFYFKFKTILDLNKNEWITFFEAFRNFLIE